MKLVLATSLVALSLAGCAYHKPVPDGYTGAVAKIRDSGVIEDRTKAQVFAVMEIDGNRIDNTFAASARASAGQSFFLTTRFVERSIPPQPMKVRLLGSHVTGAPIHAIASQMAGTFFSVEGVVDFSPKPNAKYAVKGELKKEGSSVWIEDSATNEPVTEKIFNK